MAIEIWKDYYNYEVSNLGRVRSKARKIRAKDGFINQYKAQLIKPMQNKDYPLIVRLRINKITVTKRIGDLVGKLFLDNPDNLKNIIYLDGNKQNCCVENLVWSD